MDITFWPAILKFWSKSLVYCLFASLLTGSCSNGDGSSTDTAGSKDVIHLPNNHEDPINIMEILNFHSYEVIPLEFHEESLLRGNMPQEIVYQNGFFLLNEMINEPVFAFDTAGQFITKMEVLGKGPGELASVSDFSINYGSELLHIMDYMQQQVKIFDLSDQNKKPVVIPLYDIKEEYGYVENFEVIEDGYLFFGRRKNSNSENAVIKTDTKGIILKIIPATIVDNPISGSFRAGQFIKANNEIILLKAFCDTIWIWKNNGLIPKYIIPFPDELTDRKDLESVHNNFQYKTYLETDRFLLSIRDFYVGKW